MTLLDTDILSLLMTGNPKVLERMRRAHDDVGITVIAEIQILRRRHEFLLKASDGEQLQQAQLWLERAEADVEGWDGVGIDARAAAEFDRLRQLNTLRRIGRAEWLIASIALGYRSTLATRNVRHFRHVSGLIVENWAE